MTGGGWVRGPRGDYFVVAGGAADVELEGEHRYDTVRAYLLGGRLWMRLRGPVRRWQRGPAGMVEVRWRDRRWRWTTSTVRDAHAAATAVSELLRSGAWVPQTMPQPRVRRATPILD